MNIFCFDLHRLHGIEQYIKTELFNNLFILHPYYSIEGKITDDKLKELKMSNTEVIMSLDRNGLSQIITAVKNGSFSGKYRKETTSFLIWCTINNFGVCPYDAIKEYAYVKNDNCSGNKENDLFNYLFSNVGTDIILESFFNENVHFTGKSFARAVGCYNLCYTNDTADFLFLYASILRFVYILRTEKNEIEQFNKFIEWYFENCLLSQYILSYILLYYSNRQVSPPHNYLQADTAIQGCKNQAMDILLLQELDPRRFPNNNYTFFAVTHDVDIKTIFYKANNYKGSCIDELFSFLCCDLPKGKKETYLRKLTIEYSKHKNKPNTINANNALDISRKLVAEEESRLKSILI